MQFFRSNVLPITVVFFLSLLTYSCHWRYSYIDKMSSRSIQTSGSEAYVYTKPIMADLSVRPKREFKSYEMSSDTLNYYGKLSSNSLKENARNYATFQFLMDTKSDYIIDPMVTMTRKGNTKSKNEFIIVTISGYPANVNSFSQPDTIPLSAQPLKAGTNPTKVETYTRKKGLNR